LAKLGRTLHEKAAQEAKELEEAILEEAQARADTLKRIASPRIQRAVERILREVSPR
jgi:F0F1-type ATP synthase membrane subunit b/b'